MGRPQSRTERACVRIQVSYEPAAIARQGTAGPVGESRQACQPTYGIRPCWLVQRAEVLGGGAFQTAYCRSTANLRPILVSIDAIADSLVCVPRGSACTPHRQPAGFSGGGAAIPAATAGWGSRSPAPTNPTPAAPATARCTNSRRFIMTPDRALDRRGGRESQAKNP